MSLALRLLILPGGHEISEPAHRADADSGRLELRAQPRHMDFDRVGRDLLVPGGDRVADAILAEHRLDVGEEEFEDRLLALREIERLSEEEGALARDIDHEGPVLDELGLAGMPA